MSHKTCILLSKPACLFFGDCKTVHQTSTFMFEAFHQSACPNKFRSEQSESKKNHQHSRSRSDQHDDASKKQSEPGNDKENAADLLDRAEDRGPLGKQLSGGEGGIRTHGTVSRTLAFEASAFNRSATSPRSLQTQS